MTNKKSTPKFDPKNARKHGEENQEQIKKSLEELGTGRSIVVDSEDYIIAGNGVYEQAEKLGIKTRTIESEGDELIIIKRTDLKYNDDIRRQLAIADNATGETSEWVFDELTPDEIQEWNIDIEAPKDSPKDKDEFIPPSMEFKTSIKSGDIIEIGPHRILCGDSVNMDDVKKLMGGEKADAVVTDPPYNVAVNNETKESMKVRNRRQDGQTIQNDKMSDSDFKVFLSKVFSAYHSILKKGGPIYVFYADVETINFISEFIRAGFHFAQNCIWNKHRISLTRKDYHSKHEPIIYGWKKGASHSWNADRKQTSVWDFDRPGSSKEHPTMKPIPLIKYPIRNSTKINDIVVDLFLGSGSTMVASEEIKRKCYGMEIDPRYVHVSIVRMLLSNEKLTVKVNGEDQTTTWRQIANQ